MDRLIDASRHRFAHGTSLRLRHKEDRKIKK